MSESNKGISLVIMILSVIFLMITTLFVYWQFFTIDGEEENINFSKEGNLIINNPGFIENVWYLSYESQGNPAISVRLIFNEKSICNNGTNLCSDLVIGERVEVKGIELDGEVLVKELKNKN